jgi:hypothetical protein
VLVSFGIDEKAIPTTLEEVKNHAFFAIQKTTLHKKAQKKIDKSAEKRWAAEIDVVFEPPPPSFRGAK